MKIKEAYKLAIKVEDKFSRNTLMSRGKLAAQSQKFVSTRGHTGGSRKEESRDQP